jgi:hypothetical protein
VRRLRDGCVARKDHIARTGAEGTDDAVEKDDAVEMDAEGADDVSETNAVGANPAETERADGCA